jgi:hypothetical protein
LVSLGDIMSDFIASLAALLALMFSGVASWLLLPIIVAIRFPLQRSYLGEAWGKLLSDLVAIYILVSLTVQLTQDHQNRHGDFTGWYPYISAFLLFVFTLEASIDKRQEIIREASKWTQHPELVPDIRFWRVVPAVVLPLFLFLFIFARANVPYVYAGFSTALGWLFHLRFVGSVLQVLAEILGACLFLGCLKYLLFRTLTLFARASKQESTYDA